MMIKPRYLIDFSKVAGLTVLYFMTARLGLSLGAVNGVATAVWPPTGISLAALLIFGYRLWPGVALGAFFANLSVGVAFLPALGIATGNTLEALAGAYFLLHFNHFHRTLERLSDVLSLVLLAAVLSTLISATMGTTSSWLAGVIPSGHFKTAWGTWWLGDMMGDLIVAPVFLTWSVRPILPFSYRRIGEGVGLLLLLGIVCQVLFGEHFFYAKFPYPLTFLVFPFLIWASLRFRTRFLSLAVLEISGIAIWNTLQGSGPFVRESLSESLLLLQIFMGVLAVTSLILAATVTQRKRAEEVLKQKTEELEISNKELEQFATVVSHDLQEPLLKIIAFGDRLKSHSISSLDEKSCDYLVRMQNAATRMRQLIDDLLTFSRVTRVKKAFKRVDLKEVVQRVMADLEIRMKEVGARVEVASLPTVWADELQMQRLLQNLISNALKYRKKEEGPRVILKSRDFPPGFIELIVEDHGIGFDEKYLDQIFEPFERLHPEQGDPGTGMGLAICKKIVERHGGEITAKSEPGKGARFIITLPTKLRLH